MWTMWLFSNLSLWMWNVAAASLMVSLHVAPLWVALVQAATSLPTLLFGLPFGAVADMGNRRTLLLYLQVWFALTAVVVIGLCLTGYMPPALLLALTFAYGCGVTMRLAAYGGSMSEFVPREHLSPALILNAASMNASRIAGPLIAGAIIVSPGPWGVFAGIALLAVVSFFLVRSWRPAGQPSAAERPVSFRESLRGGIAYARTSRPMQSILLRVLVFFSTATTLPALLPLVAHDLDGATPSTFTLLFAAMGIGAVTAMTYIHRLRAWLPRDKSELLGAIIYAVPMGVLVVTPSIVVAAIAMVVAGMGWLITANSLTIAMQFALPDWVRARGMAVYQMALMGSTALGAAAFGQIATMAGVTASMGLAAAGALAGMLFAVRVMPEPPQGPPEGPAAAA